MTRFETRGDEALLEHERENLLSACERGASERGELSFGGLGLFFKWSAFRGRARLRHALRSRVLRLPLPRLNEYANLAWLRDHGFGAPRPVLAGAIHRSGMPVFQFLYTEAIEGARTLRDVFESGPESLRAPALRRLGAEVARLHRFGFVHRDLFPRNVLVTGDAVHFLDAWRGGPGRGLRGPDYDLACLMLHGAELFRPDEQRLLFEGYFAALEKDGAAVRREKRLAAVARERDRLVRRLARRPGRTSTLPPPPPRWTAPSP
ncbi:MAG: hypothetical protein O7B99_14960 [Planctomycetota bacterium]|nr:hypothetical protein [Planctomycetota bacterium]